MNGCKLLSVSRESDRQVSFEQPGSTHIDEHINNTFCNWQHLVQCFGVEQMEVNGCKLMSGSRDSDRQVSVEQPGSTNLDGPSRKTF